MEASLISFNSTIELIFMIIFIVVIVCYTFLSLVSLIALRKHHLKNRYQPVDELISSKYLPGISILAPAYNEGLTIVENVRSLLSISYSDFEIVIINDGSSDDSLAKLIEAYYLSPVKQILTSDIPTQKIRAVYKSRNLAYSHLIVIDKENGGKADALNAGINVSSKKLFLSIDVDCILSTDGLLKMVRPFLEERNRKVVAVGGVIRVVNGCEIKDGKVVQVNLPSGWLERFQVLEYFRVFTLSRMGWAYMRGLLIISGALGMFDRETIVKAGGYTKGIVGEDMELVVRIHRYMREVAKKKYDIEYIPDPLCWTEVPDSSKILSRQRNRWSRGFIESLLAHKKMFFNPKFGFIGMVSYPYTFFMEWFLLLIELFGILYVVLMYSFGMLNVPFMIFLFIVVYSFFMMLTMLSVLVEEFTYHHYNKKIDLIKLMLVAMVEPFFYHPLNFYWTLKGNVDYFFRGKREWGKMDRRGFEESKNQQEVKETI